MKNDIRPATVAEAISFSLVPADIQRQTQANIELTRLLAEQVGNLTRLVQAQLAAFNVAVKPGNDRPAPTHEKRVVKAKRPATVTPKSAIPSGLLTLVEAARRLGTNKHNVHVASQRGKLKTVKIDGKRYCTEAALKAWREATERNKAKNPNMFKPAPKDEPVTLGDEDFVVPHVDSFESDIYRGPKTLQKAFVAMARWKNKGGLTKHELGELLGIKGSSAMVTINALRSLGYDILRTQDGHYVLVSTERNTNTTKKELATS